MGTAVRRRFAIQSLSFLSHFGLLEGIVSLPALIFYFSLIVFALFANRNRRSEEGRLKGGARHELEIHLTPGKGGTVGFPNAAAHMAWTGLALAGVVF